jgi:hypothetical protein
MIIYSPICWKSITRMSKNTSHVAHGVREETIVTILLHGQLVIISSYIILWISDYFSISWHIVSFILFPLVNVSLYTSIEGTIFFLGGIV